MDDMKPQFCVTKEQLFSAARAFLNPIDDSFWEEHGISFEEAVIGTAAALRSLGATIAEDVRSYELAYYDGEYYTKGYCMHINGPYKPAHWHYGCYWTIKPEDLGDNPMPPLEERVCASCRAEYEEIKIHAD